MPSGRQVKRIHAKMPESKPTLTDVEDSEELSSVHIQDVEQPDAASDDIIDPDGNIVFLVGPDQKTELQVSAKVLSLASTVFKALLAPEFTEGKELEAKGAVIIPLPDDDGKALGALCAVLHHRTEMVDSASLNSEDLFNLAILVDKYDCYKPISFWMKDCYRENPQLLSQADPANDNVNAGFDARHLSNWVFVHKVFHQDDCANRVLKSLLGDFVTRSGRRARRYTRLPQTMFDSLTTKRIAIINKTMTTIKVIVDHSRDATRFSAYDAFLLGSLKTSSPSEHCDEIRNLMLHSALSLAVEAEFGYAMNRPDLPVWSGSLNLLCDALGTIQESIAYLMKPIELKYQTDYKSGSCILGNTPRVFKRLLWGIRESMEADIDDLKLSSVPWVDPEARVLASVSDAEDHD